MARRADPKNSPGTQRLIEGLAAAVRAAKVPRRALEQRLGWSAGYVSRVLNGPIELKVGHVFAILGAIGKDPAEFFRETFPPRFSLRPAGAEEALGRGRGGAGELDPRDRHIRQVVLEMVEEFVAGASAGPRAPAPPKSS